LTMFLHIILLVPQGLSGASPFPMASDPCR
jgi:hypothetical protein